MTPEDILIEVARIERAALAAVLARIAARQLGEGFIVPAEDENEAQ
jgi:hypothetical protein